ncbi:hypothetical protein HAX54_004154 [Datura stramonium]|uniref:Uncharacterized protein n=1 Tax=Datura stramonium TaxID=4076 RepID=A0ABS8T8U4_DATST|nr:hypothetical protein [Datura stramonium]
MNLLCVFIDVDWQKHGFTCIQRRFGAKVVEEHGLKWFNSQKEAKYAPENWVDESPRYLSSPPFVDTIRFLGTTCRGPVMLPLEVLLRKLVDSPRESLALEEEKEELHIPSRHLARKN